MKYSLEVTTNIGCPVGCLKYCPQEIITSKYFGNRMMSMETFTKVLSNIPKNVLISFSGFSEPFVNPLCTEFIKMALAEKHKVELFSTLYGVTDEDFKELSNFEFESVCLHLPDGETFKEPILKNYRNHVFDFIKEHKHVNIMSMGSEFKTNNRENTARELNMEKQRYGWCSKFGVNVGPVVLPNGDVFLCCMDFGLKDFVGNLLHETYLDIVRHMLLNKGNYYNCNYCSWNQPFLFHHYHNSLRKLKEALKAEKTKC